MSVCLITAPTATDFWGSDELDSEAVRSGASDPQLGILNLAAVLESHGETPLIVDLNALYLDFADNSRLPDADGFAERAAAAILANNADIYGFSSICSSFPLTIRIAKALKELQPHARVLLGGPQASVVDVPTLQAFPFVDFILRGEAEHTLPLLLNHLGGSHALDHVSGLTYREDSAIRRNPNAPVIEDLDALPSPAYHLTRYLETATTADLELGRGCPFACTFCSTNDFFRRNFRLRSPQRVLQDMRAIAARYGVRDFQLTHDMFTVDKRRVAAFCEAMIASEEHFTWSCSARTDCVDEPLLELMAHAGCRGIFFGIETGSQRMQKVIDKHLDLNRAEEIIDITEKLGIGTTVALITGFPEETWDDVRQTMSIYMHSARHANSDPQLNLLAPLAGTPVHSQHRDHLVLEELCSDMSHQGRTQNAADLDLIRNHPDIFPNFYLLPVPNLDRSTIFELHELTSATTERFRWLLCAIHQNATHIFDFFLEWREHRLIIRPVLQATEIRQYYRTRDFRADFISFTRARFGDAHPFIATLLEYEDAISCQRSSTSILRENFLPTDSVWSLDHIPVLSETTRVVALPYDIQHVVNSLKAQANAAPQPGTYFYATRKVTKEKCRLVQISDWLAYLLHACDGTRTLSGVVAQLSFDIPEVEEAVREYAFLMLLKGAEAQGFIRICQNPTLLPVNGSSHPHSFVPSRTAQAWPSGL